MVTWLVIGWALVIFLIFDKIGMLVTTAEIRKQLLDMGYAYWKTVGSSPVFTIKKPEELDRAVLLREYLQDLRNRVLVPGDEEETGETDD